MNGERQSAKDSCLPCDERSMHCTLKLIVGTWLLALFGFTAPVMATTAQMCKIIDLMPAFWRALHGPAPAQALRATIVVPNPDLYNVNYVALPAGQVAWDKLVRADIAYVDSHRVQVLTAANYLRTQAPGVMSEFAQRFPEFRCDFPFYIAPTFGRMDGAAAFVDGHHRIVFAPDVAPRYHTLPQLRVLVDHETFHVYHHQRSGVYGATADAIPPTLSALWSEGLAVYASWLMNPHASLDDVLLQPGIPAAATPHLQAIARDLLANLDGSSEAVYGRYFMGGAQPAGYPSRTGYYVSLLIARKLGEGHGLREMAGWRGAPLRARIAVVLRELADEPPPSPPSAPRNGG